MYHSVQGHIVLILFFEKSKNNERSHLFPRQFTQ